MLLAALLGSVWCFVGVGGCVWVYCVWVFCFGVVLLHVGGFQWLCGCVIGYVASLRVWCGGYDGFDLAIGRVGGVAFGFFRFGFVVLFAFDFGLLLVVDIALCCVDFVA